MNINDYLIDQRSKNWPQLLSGWGGTIPEAFTLWLVNRFGDAFLVVDDGSVHMLDAGAGGDHQTFPVIAALSRVGATK